MSISTNVCEINNAKKLVEKIASYLMCGSAITGLVIVSKIAATKHVPSMFETVIPVGMLLSGIGMLCACSIEKNTASNLRQEGNTILNRAREDRFYKDCKESV